METMDVYQVARALKISKTTVYKLVRLKLLPKGKRLGRNRRWDIEDVKRAWKELPE